MEYGVWYNYLDEAYRCFIKSCQNAVKFKDKEDLHQARVQNRKLLTLLDLLGMNKDDLLFSRLQQAQKLLGRARDYDVLIAAFKERKCIEEDIEKKKLIKAFIKLKKRERNVQRKKLKKKLPGFLNEDTDERWRRFLTQQLNEMMKNLDFKEHLSRLERQFSNGCLAFAEAGKRGEGVQNPLKILHEIRIKAKQIRYSLSYLSVILEEDISEKINHYKKIQEQLGKINDRRVWLKHWEKQTAEQLGTSPLYYQQMIESLTWELQECLDTLPEFSYESGD